MEIDKDIILLKILASVPIYFHSHGKFHIDSSHMGAIGVLGVSWTGCKIRHAARYLNLYWGNLHNRTVIQGSEPVGRLQINL